MMRFVLFFCSMLQAAMLVTADSYAAPNETNALDTMKKATDFMMKTVSYRGGFVWKYREDLSEQWGEVPARRTQIWVQGATNGVGEMLIDAYTVTGGRDYLEYAKKVADALIWGQHPEGGWHYFIDFDMPGIRKWYDEVASKCWGWEEYYHYYGNCTFDDDTTTSSIRFLMKLYIVTLDPAYYEPLLKALNFVLEAQFPNGAWPQRYPLMYEYVKNGKPDYTSFYTFNDGVMFNNIMVLLDAYEQLGDERYYEAARRGMDFYIVSQYARPQAGWSSQHSHDMKPTYARTYEPEGVWSTSTLNNINALETFYKITGDRRYLNPIPAAVEWLESAILNTDPSKNYTHARVYELGTNKPLYTHRSGTGIENGHYYQDHEFGNFICHYGQIATIDVKAIQKEYDRVCGLTPENARAEFEQSGKNNRTAPDADSAAIETLIKSLDKRGAWITDMRISNYSDPCADGRAGTIVRGIETGVYIGNMKKLMDYVKSVKK
ncbi:pectate lyase [bacterium]|nr:pectate lyase [bacterium]